MAPSRPSQILFEQRARIAIAASAFLGMSAGVIEGIATAMHGAGGRAASAYIILTTLYYALAGITAGIALMLALGTFPPIRRWVLESESRFIASIIAGNAFWIAGVLVGGAPAAPVVPIISFVLVGVGTLGLFLLTTRLVGRLPAPVIRGEGDRLGMVAVVVLGFLVAASPMLYDDVFGVPVAAKSLVPDSNPAVQAPTKRPPTRLEIVGRRIQELFVEPSSEMEPQ